MRNIAEWAKKHRAGLRRARAIVDRQDRKRLPAMPGTPIRYACNREMARRKRQIERGQLRVSA